MIQSLKSLQEFLQQNGMKHTAHTLRSELLSKIPTKPSQQLLSLFSDNSEMSNPEAKGTDPYNKHKSNLYKKPSNEGNPIYESLNIGKGGLKNKKSSKSQKQLPVEGILGRIAYSNKLLENSEISQQINHLMDNKIFLNGLNKQFPPSQQTHNTKKVHQQKGNSEAYKDELELVSSTEKQPFDQESQSFSLIKASENQESFQLQNSSQSSELIGKNPHAQQNMSILSHTSNILEEINQNDFQEEYIDDRDMGYEEYIFEESQLMEQCGEITKKYGYPECALRKSSSFGTSNKIDRAKDKKSNRKEEKHNGSKKSKFPEGMLFPCEPNQSYPLEYNGVSYDVMKINIIFDRQKIGYETEQQLNYQKGDIIAGRYQVEKILGNGVFAKVIKAKDLSSNRHTCFKMIENNKDFLDQAMDEIKLLRYIKENAPDQNPNAQYLLSYHQAFYHRQHLFIETDLLKDNLLTAFQSNPSYFSIPVIRKVATQILVALRALHSLNIIHSDLKPENIMVKTYNPEPEIRIIDLGNGCFTHDENLGSYVQSRSYRAPQVVLGCKYNEKIDIWSFGCIIAELWTKNVLFYNHHIQGMIARIQSISGPWPQRMLDQGENVSNIFSKENLIYYQNDGNYHILVPKKTTLKNRLRTDDDVFVNFVRKLVEIDPQERLSAEQALEHPFIKDL